jgi:hypothetical protein
MADKRTADELRTEAEKLMAAAEVLEEKSKGLALAKGNPRYQLVADLIHKHGCRMNHIDMCGYEYEQWDKFDPTKGRASSTKMKWYLNAKELCTKLDELKIPHSKQEEVIVTIASATSCSLK